MNTTERITSVVSMKPMIVIKEEQMSIERSQMGKVVGRNLVNKKHLEKTYGVEITVNGEEIVIKGPADMVAATKRAIEEILLSETISFLIDKDYVSLVIGLKGERIASLRKMHNVKIIINNEGEVNIVGNKSRCEAAKEDIEFKINQAKIDHPYEEKFSVPVELLDHVAGMNRSNLIRIQSTYNVHVSLPSTKDGRPDIWVKGTSAEAVSSAKKDIQDALVNSTSFFIEKEYVGFVIGREGESINHLQKVHNVTIDINKGDGKVVIAGRNMSGCEACKEAIESLIEKKTIATHQEKFFVPADLLGFVTGKNGSNSNRIQTAYGVQVILPSVYNGQSCIVVKGGSTEMVSEAKKDILENLPMTLRWDVDDNFVDEGVIIGRRGETVQRLCKEYGVIISVRDERAYIWGEKIHCEDAKDAILSIIFAELSE